MRKWREEGNERTVGFDASECRIRIRTGVFKSMHSYTANGESKRKGCIYDDGYDMVQEQT